MTRSSFRATGLLAAFLVVAAVQPSAVAGPVLDRILAEKTIRLGVRTDAPPFASVVDGRPQGFTVDLCGLIAGAILATSKIEELNGTFIPVDTGDRFSALTEGKIDVLCGATTATLKRRETVSFTIPVFSTGVGAVVAKAAPPLVTEVLVTGGPAALSKAAVTEALAGKTVGVRTNTTAAAWLERGPLSKIEGLKVTQIGDHADGVAGVKDGSLSAYFADKAILMAVAAGSEDTLAISRATFTYEPYALAIPRGDEDLRLVLDRALSFLYRRGAILDIYQRHFGKPTPEVALFYGLVSLPE